MSRGASDELGGESALVAWTTFGTYGRICEAKPLGIYYKGTNDGIMHTKRGEISSDSWVRKMRFCSCWV